MGILYAIAQAVGLFCVVVLGILAALYCTGWVVYKAIDWIAQYFRVMDALFEFLVHYLRTEPEIRAEYKRRRGEGAKFKLVRKDGSDW
jgi:hypothetical protein